MSFDNPTDNAAWRTEEGFDFDLWSDTKAELGLYYGAASVATQLHAARVTKLLDADGTLILEYVDSISVGEHPGLVLADCQAIFGG